MYILSKLNWLALPFLVFIALIFIFGISLKKSDLSELPSVLVGKVVPDYDFPPLDGLNKDGVPVRGFKGSDRAHKTPLAINFFASWCAPCIQEHPVLKQLGSETGIRMIGINYKDRVDDGLRFLKRLGNPFDQVGVDLDG
ncbi:MAG: DsbE family thiol:disulfide interchange protein, partial [Hyphomicrobiaceae bacterium]|nr:DsbE family thiol:disulfide interchange protein [Hyphomicrobiaceae bacterium]